MFADNFQVLVKHLCNGNKSEPGNLNRPFGPVEFIDKVIRRDREDRAVSLGRLLGYVLERRFTVLRDAEVLKIVRGG